MNHLYVNQNRQINIQPRPQSTPEPSSISPNVLTCPLTGEPFTDPVIAPNGVTYNADAIYPYVQEHGHLPTDDLPVTPRRIWPDQNMRDRLFAHTLDDEDEHLGDPITFDTMTHPVVASDGRTYNQSTLEMLFRENDGISPFSRDRFGTTGYRNQTLMTELNPLAEQAPDAAFAEDPTRNLVTFERAEAAHRRELRELRELQAELRQFNRLEHQNANTRYLFRSGVGLAAAIAAIALLTPLIIPPLAAISSALMLGGVIVTVAVCSLAGQVLGDHLGNLVHRGMEFIQNRGARPEDD